MSGEIAMMTAAQLMQSTGCNHATSDKWLSPLSEAMQRYYIFTSRRKAAFLAQIAHESARMTTVEENLNYSAEGLLATFSKYFTIKQAQLMARNEPAIGNRVYANRMGNGDESSGDGYKYRGRGLIQITGHDNYVACGVALNLPLVTNPEILTTPNAAALSAAWFFHSHGCNELADADNFAAITKKINGGLNGQAERLAFFAHAEAAFV